MNNREIVLDTETTGISPKAGHRIVEIGCVELINHIATGERFHRYVDPDRDIEPEAVAIHGLTREFLSNHPPFADLAGEFLDFIGDAPLVIHNADFDMGFLNAELALIGFPPLPPARATCTMKMARQKYPGAPASLDALCKKYNVDNTGRTLHGALLDAQLLAEVYIELVGGRQGGLVLAAEVIQEATSITYAGRVPRPHGPTEEELAAHAAMLALLKNPMWSATG